MHLIDLTRLADPAATNYLTNADRRTKAGARYIFDMFDIPLPAYLERMPAGRPFSNRIMQDFRKDNPESQYEATQRRSREYASRLSARDASSAILR